MAESPRPRRQKAICAICEQPIGEGEGIRRITPPAAADALPAHSRCYDRDWERIESGLEPFPLAKRTARPS
jgi:hypothetical protein